MKNWRTSLASIVTALGLVPMAIQQLNLEVVPNWLKIVGLAATFFGTIGIGLLAKDKNVTGVGENAETKADVEARQDYGDYRNKNTRDNL